MQEKGRRVIAEPADFPQFRALSAAIGDNPLLVQGAGGNTSIKHEGAMWIKASGAWLKHATAENLFAIIDHADSLAQLEREAEPAYRRLDDNPALRPSIETSLHAILPHRIVAHVHAVEVIALAIRQDAESRFREKLAGLRFVFVPYVKPGWPLTQALRKKLAPEVPAIIILGNHGLIVGGKSVAEVKSLLADIEQRLKAATRVPPPADTDFLKEATGQGRWRLPKLSLVRSLATDSVSHAYATGGTLYPDHVVFLGRGCHAVSGDRLHTADSTKHPIILVKDKGVLLASNLSSSGEAMVDCLAEVLARVPPDVKLNYLSSHDEDELLGWDAEQYRQNAT